MSETDALVLLLALIYLGDCVAWVRRGAVAFRALGFASFHATTPSPFTGNARAGLVWANPLPPLGVLFVAESWPIAFSPEGLASVPGLELDSKAPRVPRWNAARWSETREIRAAEKELWVDGRLFARADTTKTANELARFAERLRVAPPKEREALIDAALAARLDVERVRELADRFASATLGVRVATNALFVFLAVVVPLVLWRWGLLLTWPWLAAGLVLGLASTAWVFRSAHAELFPDERSARRRELILLAASPPQAVRAVDALARPLLAGFDPLAVAILLEGEARERLVRSILVDVFHPLPAPVAAEPFAVDCERWFRSRLQVALERATKRLGLDARKLLEPPPTDDRAARATCLRCGLESAEPAGVCSDCGAPLRTRD
ncbi:MAG: hypothetical protein K8S98_10300 [Planctomycetes bacterium]|nr:hypothetical protein [Planctomycetota bacterium]